MKSFVSRIFPRLGLLLAVCLTVLGASVTLCLVSFAEPEDAVLSPLAEMDLYSRGGFGRLPEGFSPDPALPSEKGSTAAVPFEEYFLEFLADAEPEYVDSWGCYAFVVPMKSAGYIYRSDDESMMNVYAQALVQPILNGRAELFFLDGGFSASYYPGQKPLTMESIYLVSLYSPSELKTVKEEYAVRFAELANMAQSDWTDLEYCLYYHDLLCAFYEYDIEGLTSGTPIYDSYQFMTEGRGVCQAYTLLYGALLRYRGVETTEAVSPSLNHIWNLVCVSGKWYHVDCTWDDPTLDHAATVYHEYFLRSDNGIADAKQRPLGCWSYNDGKSYTPASDYDNWIPSVSENPIHFYRGVFYYQSFVWDGDNAVCAILSYNPATGASSLISRLADGIVMHGVLEGGGRYYMIGSTCFGFGGYGNKIYWGDQVIDWDTLYGTNIFYCMDLDSGKVTEIERKTGAYGTFEYYAGVRVWNNRVEYCTVDDPRDMSDSVWHKFFVPVYPDDDGITMDVDGDGTITNTDITLLIRYLAGWRDDRFHEKNADADLNGVINNRDVIAVVRYLSFQF